MEDRAIGGLVFGVVVIVMAFVLNSSELLLGSEVGSSWMSACELEVDLADSVLSPPPESLS